MVLPAGESMAFWSFRQPIALWRGKHIELDCRDYSVVTERHRKLISDEARARRVPVICGVLPFPVTYGPHREGELSPAERGRAEWLTTKAPRGKLPYAERLAKAYRRRVEKAESLGPELWNPLTDEVMP